MQSSWVKGVCAVLALTACSPDRPIEVATGEREGRRATSTTEVPTSSSATTSPASPSTTTTIRPRPVTTTSAPGTTTTARGCLTTRDRFGVYVFDAHLVDESHGYVAGTGTIRSTADAGATWTVACLPEYVFGAVLALAIRGQRAWAAGIPRTDGSNNESPFILRSTDGGQVWRHAELPPGATGFKDIAFPDDEHGWAVGQRPQTNQVDYGPQYGGGALLLRSRDGGRTWEMAEEFDPDVAGGLNRLSFPDADHGWAAGQTRSNTPALLATSDGGETWRPRAVPADVREIHDVFFVDETHGWITAALGELSSAMTGILSTSDGGATWGTQWSAAKTPVTALTFVDADHGWVAANPEAGGTVMATTDGGATWTATLTPGWALGTISFADARHGWVAGRQGGEVYATSDGGATWRRRPITGP
jgi:photosystem II stability/assembly factor-like uncharacterized protein